MYALRCCVEAPSSFSNKARYSLEMLLLPLGIRPLWVDRGELGEGGLYYGTDVDKAPAEAIRFKLEISTVQFFDDLTPLSLEDVIWIEKEGVRIPVLFEGAAEKGDIIASAFFWLAGWQELLIRKRDQHGRFLHADSYQAQIDIACFPVVDAYRNLLAARLTDADIPIQQLKWGTQSWAFCPTHDIDYLWKWRPGMVFREVVEYLMLNRLQVSGGERLARFGSFAFDALKPGDIFRKAFLRMIESVRKVGGKATYFIKTDAHGPNDVYYRPRNAFLRRTLHKLDTLDFEIGLHPSYHAQNHIGYLRKEKKLLQALSLRRIRSVRQHYLRFDESVTATLHTQAGFSIDSTLAFPDHEGFRNGTCHPFRIYDTHADKSLEIWEMPLCIMDGVIFNRRNMTLDEAVAASQRLIDVCKKFGGVCVGLWHNTLWDELDFPGWGAHFEQTLDQAISAAGYMNSLKGALDAYLPDSRNA